MKATAIAYLMAFSLGCCGKSSREGLPSDVPALDLELTEGTVLRVPVDGPFPRLGLQWIFGVEHEGFTEEAVFPARVAYRLTSRDGMGHPWVGWWLYAGLPEMEQTGATFDRDLIYWHPPRGSGFRVLEWAPWPIARPGKPGTGKRELVLGPGWGADTGKRILKTYRDAGLDAVEVPAGRFERAWLVEASSPGWSGRFWWTERVGFCRMLFVGDDGRRLDLRLLELRAVKVSTDR